MLLLLELAWRGKGLLKCSFISVNSHLLLMLLFSSGSAIQQTSDTIVKGSQEVLLSCSQQKTEFSYMYWYKQEREKDSQLQLVAFSLEGFGGSDTIQKEFEGRFESPGMFGFVFNVTLKDAKLSDTGTYFCAKRDYTVSHLHRKPDTNLFNKEYTGTLYKRDNGCYTGTGPWICWRWRGPVITLCLVLSNRFRIKHLNKLF